MHLDPFFSIIIPTYNREKFLPIAIESIINQTFLNWELLIIDDGSTDSSKEICEEFCRNDKRIKYYYQINSERSAARNLGVEHSKGKLICFLDSDDYFLPQRLEVLSEKVKNNNSVYYTGLILENQFGRLKKNEKKIFGKKKFDAIYMATIHSQQVCIPSHIAKKFKFNPDFNVGEDLELWLRINEFYSFEYINDAYSIVLVDHEDRTVNLQKHNSSIQQLKTLKYICSKGHPGFFITKSIKNQKLSNCYFNMAKHHMLNKQKIKSIWAILKSLFQYPKSKSTKHKIFCLLLLITNRIPKEYQFIKII